MKLGFLYAGQGSQSPGMGKDLYEAYPAFRRVFDEVKLDFDLKTLCFMDPDGLLGETCYTQPCMVAFAAGLTAVLREMGVSPDAAAGLSLGEYSALHAAGVFDAQAAIKLAAYRGQAMHRAAQGVESSMAAVLGLGREALQCACDEASDAGVVVIANDNCPGQLVIGGERAAVEKAAQLAKAAGARRCLPLRVSGPFHTPLMRPAADALSVYLAQMQLQEPAIPVFFNCLGDVKAKEDKVADLLVRQVYSGVRMADCLRRMADFGVDALIEIGPGSVLSGFARKTVPGIPVYAVQNVKDVEELEKTLDHLRKES